jgi:hypothetical protein
MLGCSPALRGFVVFPAHGLDGARSREATIRASRLIPSTARLDET